MTPCAAPPCPGWAATGAAERTDESSPMTSPRPFRHCPAWATPPAWVWVPLACERHMTVLGVGGGEEQAGWGRKSKRLWWPPNSWLSGLTPSWLSTCPSQTRLNLLPKCTLASLLTNYRDSRHFFTKWMFGKRDIGKKSEKMCCNKEACNGACFWIFYSVHLCGEKKQKKNLTLQCDACVVPFQWSCWP